MDIFYYQDPDLGYSPVENFLSSYEPSDKDDAKRKIKKINHGLKINAVISHVANGARGFSMPTAKEVDRCHDNKPLHEIRTQISKILIRIFFVSFDGKLVLFDWLTKPHKYEKEIEKGVDKDYKIKIANTKEFYKKALLDGDCLKKYKNKFLN